MNVARASSNYTDMCARVARHVSVDAAYKITSVVHDLSTSYTNMASETCYCCNAVHKTLTKYKPFDFFTYVELRFLCDSCYESEWCFCCHEACVDGDYITIDYDSGDMVKNSTCIVHMCRSCVSRSCLDDRICANAWCGRELADFIKFDKKQCVLKARYGYEEVYYLCCRCN
ncbi:cyun52 [Cyclophragma undans nucleopolyhedrovirus]|uniref:Cyun52 n=1 Tax=Cyclophragma undans nucleopolyhedrovirus TaxID=1906244 RepID=A0A288QZJ5_9ABAC|nr:cyun52 [Cyclophragma undans nucleopolyhedrovirus]AOT85522.1 cyun52 [Cyclophragma undans nucleopolyhedrovirus]